MCIWLAFEMFRPVSTFPLTSYNRVEYECARVNEIEKWNWDD
jgi:hypothetical protein